MSRVFQRRGKGLFRVVSDRWPAPSDAARGPPTPQVPPVRCREITAADVGGVVDLLTEGFRAWRDRAFWVSALDRLREHPTPSGFPKYGYVLLSGDTAVGVLLLISTWIKHAGKAGVRCNVSSWYVKPQFRVYGSLLSLRAQRHTQATYFNITPAQWTLAILEAQGYTQYCKGSLFSVPLLSGRSGPITITEVMPGLSPDWDLNADEVDLLLKHVAYGCLSVTCTSPDGRHPFVFALRRRFGLVKYAILLYCRNQNDFVRFANPLGHFLAWRGIPLVVLDANTSVEGLVGFFSTKYPKYYKGEQRPDLGDLAFSERALLEV